MDKVAKVFFTNLRTKPGKSLLDKLNSLLESLEVKKRFNAEEIIAIKIHFGEKGNLSFIRPNFVRTVVEYLNKAGVKVFVTDCNTLYRGTRSDSVNHIITALENGFNYTVIKAPIIIGDGLRGNNAKKVEVSLKHFKTVSIGEEIANSDGLVVMSHFKGHELTGFGGALKNLGMGCASREGKLAQHSNIAPSVKKKNCVSCGICVKWCQHGAITMVGEKAEIISKDCVGCAECILVCPKGAIVINWNEQVPILQEKMVEYAYGVVKDKKEKVIYINFLTQISPACDCYGHNDMPITADIGILASHDPVAIDQASCDLVNGQVGFKETMLKSGYKAGEDKFKGLYPDIDWKPQMEYAEKIGLGTRNYTIVKVD